MSRPWLFGVGLCVLALAWAPQTALLLGHGFAAHMTRHMAVVAIAAPLIALGIAGGRFDPSRDRPLLFAAIPASLVELFVVWGWHSPAAHDLARESMGAYAAEQASFLISGLWVWIACFGHGVATRASRTAAGIIAMLLTSIHMTLLGALLAMSVRPLYAAHGHAMPDGLTIFTSLDDQHLGGVVMLLVGGAAYLAGGVTLAARLLRDDGPEAGGGKAPPPTSPQRGEVDRRSRAGEGERAFPERAKPPHPALRADLSPPGRGEERRAVYSASLGSPAP